ncbi:hypothetical protein EJ06DRAFT_530008 [Trichodelitschia bisporula]|uniref:Secreted protein n=1 Tax=Trichodelitschia bisporula TaxID=703511 RepID=A0A6G1HYM5_9PEZI|nr:hypothetical protein EJ06DRAFT_530008 [Trichodelitschia bisporula]
MSTFMLRPMVSIHGCRLLCVLSTSAPLALTVFGGPRRWPQDWRPANSLVHEADYRNPRVLHQHSQAAHTQPGIWPTASITGRRRAFLFLEATPHTHPPFPSLPLILPLIPLIVPSPIDVARKASHPSS